MTSIQERYSRQILFKGIGPEGQRRLQAARVLIVGCGALGSAQAENLARAGVGFLRLADRDYVEESNLQRQSMYTEADALERMPKAEASKRRINAFNSAISVDAEVTDVTSANVERLIDGCDLVMDGTDNFATRYLINDACVKHSVPWIYGAAVGSYGVTMTVIPRDTPCLRCVFPEAPPVGSAPTCDTAGVIMSIINVVAAVQVAEALKLLTGNEQSLHRSLMHFDVWRNDWRRIALKQRDAECRTCALDQYDTLTPEAAEFVAVLCGRDAVQVAPTAPAAMDFAALAARLEPSGNVKVNLFVLRFATADFELTLFKDGRAIIRGVDDPVGARAIYARYIGN